MTGNRNSGRKRLKIKSVEYRFMMPGKLDAELSKKADTLEIDKRKLLQKITAEYLDIQFY